MHEPVSPELVLVDPELAWRERARLVERAELAALSDIATLRRAVETTTVAPQPRESLDVCGIVRLSRGRVLAAVGVPVLFVNGLLAADLVAGGTDAASRPALATLPAASLGPVSSVEPVTQDAASAPSRHEANRPSASSPAAAKAAIERRLVSLIIAAPPRKLPSRLVDSSTGLVKNNVQVVCRRRAARSFLCVVRPPNSAPREGLYVSYRQARSARGVFTWYGYKRGLHG